jgi:lysophospholipase L1-like esterase
MLKRCVTFGSLILIIFISSCDQPTYSNSDFVGADILPAMTITWDTLQTVVCYGTSLTYGYGVKDAGFVIIGGPTGGSPAIDSSYPGWLRRHLKIPVVNAGIVGATTEYGLSHVQSNVFSKRPALVLLEFGANDFLQRKDVAKTDSLLTVLVMKIQQYGSVVVLVSFIDPEMTNYMSSGRWTTQDSLRAIDYHSMLIDVAKRTSVQLIGNSLKNVFGIPSMMSDDVHPNGRGYYRMFRNISIPLNNTFAQSGMLK